MKVVIFLLIISVSISCSTQNNIELTKIIAKKIDRDSQLEGLIDVYNYFQNKELPNIYRLGAITYKYYTLDKKLTKMELVFEGDRETLKKSYYFDENRNIFFLIHNYKFYDPPKWDKNSKEISMETSSYLIKNSTVLFSIGENILIREKIISEITLINNIYEEKVK